MVSKAQAPALQHYVPKIYLQYFRPAEESGKVWILHPNSHWSYRPYLKGLKAVCSSPDYYTIHKPEDYRFIEDKITDPYVIEREGFAYESQQIEGIWTQLIEGAAPFPGERLVMARLFLSLKRRTPRFKEKFTDPELVQGVGRNLLDRFVKSQEKRLDVTALDGSTWADVVRDVATQMEKEFSKPEFPRNAYLSGFLSGRNDRLDNRLLRMLTWSNFFIAKAEGRKFITSDNPGFTMLQTGEMTDIDFTRWQAYYHVLTPDYLLVISPFPLRKIPFIWGGDFWRFRVSDGFVDEINLCTVKNCNNIIIGGSAEDLAFAHVLYLKETKGKPQYDRGAR